MNIISSNRRKKKCELCESEAKTYCESDRALLCWACDSKVHSANFLVAKHSRNLLCRICHSLTPWSAAGSALSPTVSLCRNCLSGHQKLNTNLSLSQPQSQTQEECEEEEKEEEEYHDNDHQTDSYSDDEDEDEDEDDDDDDDDENDEDNQVVPWSERQQQPSISLINPHTSFSSRGRFL